MGSLWDEWLWEQTEPAYKRRAAACCGLHLPSSSTTTARIRTRNQTRLLLFQHSNLIHRLGESLYSDCRLQTGYRGISTACAARSPSTKRMSSTQRIKPGKCPCHGTVDEEEAFKGEAKFFGEKAGFWRLHDEITDKHDSDMMGRLNTGLDNLLIFVSRMRPRIDGLY